MMFRKAASLIISAMLIASVSVASYAQQANQCSACLLVQGGISKSDN